MASRSIHAPRALMDAPQAAFATEELARITAQIQTGVTAQVKSLDEMFRRTNQTSASLNESASQASSIASSAEELVSSLNEMAASTEQVKSSTTALNQAMNE